MAVIDEEKQAAIYELKTKFDTNNGKLKQVHFHPFFSKTPAWSIHRRQPLTSPSINISFFFPLAVGISEKSEWNQSP